MWMSIQEPYLLTVRQDDFFPDPRRENENFGTMICFHRRYQLGDEHQYFSSDDLLEEMFINAAGGGDKGKQKYDDFADSFDLHPGTLAKIQAYNRALMAEIEKAYVVLPVYLRDHSGLSISTHSFNDPWDSGQTGIIFASIDKIREEYGVETITPEIRQKAEDLLRGEVEQYDAYLNGECYGYELYKSGEVVDSCWGFTGAFDKACEDIADYLPDGCRGMIKDLSEVNDAPSVIQTLMKHARIQAAQAEKDHNREPQQKSLEAVLS